MGKHPALLSRERTGLLIVDLQEKFAPVIPDFDEIISNVAKLVLTFQMFDLPIIVTEQYPQGLGNTVEVIRKQFKFLESIEKTAFAATDVPAFWTQVRNKDLTTLVVCGVEAHVCINQTVLELIQHGLTAHVIVDAIGSRYRLDFETALRKMERAGAILDTTEMCLFELAKEAGTESFRNISRLVKTKKKLTTAPSAATSASVAPPQAAPQKSVSVQVKETKPALAEKPAAAASGKPAMPKVKASDSHAANEPKIHKVAAKPATPMTETKPNPPAQDESEPVIDEHEIESLLSLTIDTDDDDFGTSLK